MTDEDVLIGMMSRLLPLNCLGVESLRELARLSRRECLMRHLDPFSLKDWAGQVVYLIKGELKIDQADGSTLLIVGGSGEALMPLPYNGDVRASGKAITDIELLRFDENALDIVVTWDQMTTPDGAVAGEDATDWHTKSGMFAARNLTNGVFASLPAANIELLLARFRRVLAARGETIVRQGDVGYFYYVIDRGRCSVTRQIAGTTVQLAELKGGDAFGEEAFLAHARRNATVTMKTDGVLLRLDKADFTALLSEPLLQRLTADAAEQRIAAGAIWIDTRFPAEYRHDGLPGAINIPLNELRQATAMLEQGREYIVYCQSGRRSSAAAFLLSQRGYRASLLDGGLKALMVRKGMIEA